jgi:hypothetical protein
MAVMINGVRITLKTPIASSMSRRQSSVDAAEKRGNSVLVRLPGKAVTRETRLYGTA